MKKANHLFARLWAVVLALALLSGCGTGADTGTGENPELAGQGTEGSPESAGQGGEGGWKPTGPVNVIVGYAPGGGMDLMARTIAQYIDLDGQPMHITNIEGGGGYIAAMEAYNLDNDGHTVLLHSIEGLAGTYFGNTNAPDFNHEMTWINCMVDDAAVFAVAAGSPYETLEDVLTAAKDDPGGVSVASLSTVTMSRIVDDIQTQAGIQFAFVPYDSTAKSRTAVLGGHQDVLHAFLSEVKAYADSGELRILMLQAEERSGIAPDVPTLSEYGINVLYAVSRGYLLPPGTDEKIARYYDEKLKEVFDNEEFQATMRDTLGYNLVFTGMDGIGEKVEKFYVWAEEFLRHDG